MLFPASPSPARLATAPSAENVHGCWEISCFCPEDSGRRCKHKHARCSQIQHLGLRYSKHNSSLAKSGMFFLHWPWGPCWWSHIFRGAFDPLSVFILGVLFCRTRTRDFRPPANSPHVSCEPVKPQASLFFFSSPGLAPLRGGLGVEVGEQSPLQHLQRSENE